MVPLLLLQRNSGVHGEAYTCIVARCVANGVCVGVGAIVLCRATARNADDCMAVACSLEMDHPGSRLRSLRWASHGDLIQKDLIHLNGLLDTSIGIAKTFTTN